MTTELLDLDPLPDDLASSAYTLVAVRGPNGPMKFRSLVTGGGAGGGEAGPGYSGASINSQGHLILTRTDGTTQDLGLVTGLAGPGFVSAAINGSGHLILTKTNGDTEDLGSVGGGSASLATTSAAGLVKPDGTTLTLGSGGVLSVAGQDPETVPAASIAAGNEGLLFFDPSTGLFHSVTPAVLATYMLANDGSADILQAPIVTDASQIAYLFGAKTDGTVVRVAPSTLGTTSSGSGGTTPTYATTMTISAPSTMTVGTASTVTVTGGSGGLDPTKTFTPSAPVAGTFSPTSRVGNGTTALTFSFTPSAAVPVRSVRRRRV